MYLEVCSHCPNKLSETATQSTPKESRATKNCASLRAQRVLPGFEVSKSLSPKVQTLVVANTDECGYRFSVDDASLSAVPQTINMRRCFAVQKLRYPVRHAGGCP